MHEIPDSPHGSKGSTVRIFAVDGSGPLKCSDWHVALFCKTGRHTQRRQVMGSTLKTEQHLSPASLLPAAPLSLITKDRNVRQLLYLSTDRGRDGPKVMEWTVVVVTA